MTRIVYRRFIGDHIRSWLFSGKVIILYGARQVGKTTLVKAIAAENAGSLYLNCEARTINELLSSGNLERIRAYIGNVKLVVFDEAQKVKDVGQVLKIFHDTWPDLQLLATGSSSFDLLNELSEPLTGRNVKFMMHPLSVNELRDHYHISTLDDKITQFLRFGMYPDLIDRPEHQIIKLLDTLTSDYLFRDVLRYNTLKHPGIIGDLLKALALQAGNEVSMNELSRLLKVSAETIQRYIEILERSFVIFRLRAFSRNMRKELAHSQKFYFLDTGLRNSLIQNFNQPSDRTDTGALWENFCIVERMKANLKNRRNVNYYFWRTYDQREIDLVEESGGKLSAFEFKYNPSAKVKRPEEFLSTYPGSEYMVIHRENIFSFVE